MGRPSVGSHNEKKVTKIGHGGAASRWWLCRGAVITAESADSDDGFLFARAGGVSSVCGSCMRAKHRYVSSSGMFTRGYQVGSHSPAQWPKNSSVPLALLVALEEIVNQPCLVVHVFGSQVCGRRRICTTPARQLAQVQ